MHRRTEDLLSLRDHEPMDAQQRAQLLQDRDALRELEALHRMRDAMRALPDPNPPARAWEALQARLDEMGENAARPHRPTALWRWSAGGAIAAGVAVAALWLVGAPGPIPTVQDAPETSVSFAAASFATTGSGVPNIADRPVVPVTYASAVAQSEHLDRLMSQLPGQRSTMSASTASLIAGLEDQVAWLDQEILLATAYGVPPEQRLLLWSQRVEMMNALLHLRYAQAQDP
jgi:hypothetical protein